MTNQGVYFGQIVVGPAGSGKVITSYIQVYILHNHAINGINPQKKYTYNQS